MEPTSIPPLNVTDPPECLSEEREGPGDDQKQLAAILTDVARLLQRIDQRSEAVTDLTQQPIPQVPSTSSSAWNPLFRTFISETVHPKVDRWRNGLDALLVFLGLFSAIVTAFLVDSIGRLKQNDSARTNELLANLTEILIALSPRPPENLTFTTPVVFEPDASDIRVNSLYSLSLVLSLSIAALAVAGRGFLTMVTWSMQKKVALRLTDIQQRWAAVEHILCPVIEALPQLLVFPVLLFIMGIFDMLLSAILQLARRPVPLLATTALCLVSIAVVAGLFGTAIIESVCHPYTSAFQSPLASWIRSKFARLWSSPWSSPHRPIVVVNQGSSTEKSLQILHTNKTPIDGEPVTISPKTVQSYHDVIQAIHDDEALDQAISCLQDILNPHRTAPRDSLTGSELATFIHLLSPEASSRSNRTAATVFCATFRGRYTGGWRLNPDEEYLSIETALGLLQPLLDAARRHNKADASIGMLDSPFIRAIAVIAGYDADLRLRNSHPVAFVLGTPAFNWRFQRDHPEVADTVREILRLMLTLLSFKVNRQDIKPSFDMPWRVMPDRAVQLDYLRTHILSPYELRLTFLEHLVLIPHWRSESSDRKTFAHSDWVENIFDWLFAQRSVGVILDRAFNILQSDLLKQSWVTRNMKDTLLSSFVLLTRRCATNPLPPEETMDVCIFYTSSALKYIECDLEFEHPILPTLSFILTVVDKAQKFMDAMSGEVQEYYRSKFLQVNADLVKIEDWLEATQANRSILPDHLKPGRVPILAYERLVQPLSPDTGTCVEARRSNISLCDRLRQYTHNKVDVETRVSATA